MPPTRLQTPQLPVHPPTTRPSGARAEEQRRLLVDPDAFDAVVHEHSAAIARLVNRLIGWTADADDVVQEVFVRAWLRRHSFRGDASVSTWLQAIAVNECRNHRRRRLRWEMVLAAFGQTTRRDAVDSLARLTVQQQVRAAVGQLKSTDREVIVLCCMEQKTAREAAEILNLSRNAVDVRLHRARQRLKQILESGDEPNRNRSS